MAQLINNPWSLTSADPAIATITGATGLTLNGDGSVTITTTGALTFNATADSNLAFTVIGAANAAYNGLYYRFAGVSGASSFNMTPQFAIPAGTAQSGGGTLAQVLYRHKVRIEDISWQATNTGTGVTTGLLQLVDRNGNDIWRTAIGATGTFGQLNRGKLFWVAGLVPISVPINSEVFLTIN